MKHIFIRELQSLIKDVRFFLFIAIVMVVSIFSGVISSYNYETINSENESLRNNYETSLKENCQRSLHDACYMSHIAVQKAPPFMFLVASESLNYPNYSIIEISNLFFGNPDLYYPKKSLSTDISYLRFLRYDMMFMIEVIFSFMVILLVHDIISKEKESGTLRQILANKIPRHELFLGKILACAVVIGISLIVGMVLELLVVLWLGKIPIDYSILMNVPPLLIFSFCYLLFWAILSALLSTLARRSSVSLTYLLIIWVLAILIVPSLGRVIVHKAVGQLPTSNRIAQAYQEINDEFWSVARSQNGAWRGGNLRANARDDHLSERNLAPVHLQFLEKLNRYQYSIATQRIDHLRFLYDFASISPSFLFRRITESICGAGIERQYRFVESIQRHRSDLMETFRKLDLQDEDSIHLAFLPRYMSFKPVNADLIPRFEEEFPSNIRLIVKNWWLILLFFSEILIVFLVGYFAFLRFDPR